MLSIRPIKPPELTLFLSADGGEGQLALVASIDECAPSEDGTGEADCPGLRDEFLFARRFQVSSFE